LMKGQQGPPPPQLKEIPRARLPLCRRMECPSSLPEPVCETVRGLSGLWENATVAWTGSNLTNLTWELGLALEEKLIDVGHRSILLLEGVSEAYQTKGLEGVIAKLPPSFPQELGLLCMVSAFDRTA
jgi:hypothetical protein